MIFPGLVRDHMCDCSGDGLRCNHRLVVLVRSCVHSLQGLLTICRQTNSPIRYHRKSKSACWICVCVSMSRNSCVVCRRTEVRNIVLIAMPLFVLCSGATKHRIGYIGVQIMLLLDMTQYKVVIGKRLGSVLVKQFSRAQPGWGLGRRRDHPQNIIRLRYVRCIRCSRCGVSSHPCLYDTMMSASGPVAVLVDLKITFTMQHCVTLDWLPAFQNSTV